MLYHELNFGLRIMRLNFMRSKQEVKRFVDHEIDEIWDFS